MTAITSFCPQTAGGSGTEYKASNWASLAPGEIRFSSAAEQTIQAPGTAPANVVHLVGTRLHDPGPANNRLGGRVQAAGGARRAAYTIAGASTVIAEFSTPAANDQVIARLYDVNETAKTEQLIGRARPTGR